MRVNRPRIVLAVTALIASGVAVSIPPGAGAAQCGAVRNALGKWSAIDMPPTPSIPVEGAAPIAATTLVGQDPNVLLSTDGVSVYRSTDAGCKWRTTYTLGPADYWSDNGITGAYSITNIVNGHSAAAAAHQTVYLALSPNPLNVLTFATLFTFAPPELFMVSHDGGQTFAPVQPAPSVARPLVPECLSAPQLMIVAPADSREIYLQCPGGLAQSAAARIVAGGEPAYRSLDGGQSWSLIGLPTNGQYDTPWFTPGLKAHELWIAGEWYNAVGNQYLGVWHTVDDGAHWTMSKPAPKPGLGIGPIGVAVDPLSGSGAERLVAYAPVGAYISTDGAKHWAALRDSGPAGSGLAVAQAFFVRHTAYVIGIPTTVGCKPGAVLFRYANPHGRPTRTAFPSQWGVFFRWGSGNSFASANGGTAAFGVVSFCATTTTPAGRPKLLSFQPR